MEYKTSDNKAFALGGLKCKLGALCFYSSSVLVNSFCSKACPNAKAKTFDLLLWFNQFIENNLEKTTQKARWKRKESYGVWVPGNVTRIPDNGWSTFQPDNAYPTVSIPPKR